MLAINPTVLSRQGGGRREGGLSGAAVVTRGLANDAAQEAGAAEMIL